MLGIQRAAKKTASTIIHYVEIGSRCRSIYKLPRDVASLSIQVIQNNKFLWDFPLHDGWKNTIRGIANL